MPDPSQSYPLVYIVVLNWNNYSDTRRCLTSLQNLTYPRLRIVLADNASFDGSAQRLQEEFSECLFVFNEENLGFARGCNRGIQIAMEDKDCAYVLLLNNDATISRDKLERAIQFADADPRLGVISGKLLSSNGLKTIWYAG